MYLNELCHKLVLGHVPLVLGHVLSVFKFLQVPNPIPVDTGRKLNVNKTFRRHSGRLLNVLCTFNLRPVSTRASFVKWLESEWTVIQVMIRRFGSSTLAQEYEKAEVWIQREISENMETAEKRKNKCWKWNSRLLLCPCLLIWRKF